MPSSLTGSRTRPSHPRRRLAPGAQPELRQDVAHVVLDGLAADVEAVGDLRVRQAAAEELEDLGLPPREHAAGWGARSRRGPHAEGAEDGGGGVDVAAGVEAE